MDWHAKIKKIEALIAGAKSEGERKAAALAKSRILERVQEEVAAQPIEYTVPLGNYWKKKLFVALCSKHQLQTPNLGKITQKSAEPEFCNSLYYL